MPRSKKSNSQQNFFADVYEVVKLIPKGRVTSYGAIAPRLQVLTSNAYDMLPTPGHGLAANLHRVVNSAGLLTGKHHFKKPDTMEKLLAREKVKVVNNKIQRFTEHFWDPSRELA